MTLMIRSKVLTDAAWKDVLAKNKAVKDNGMLKALADIKKLGDDDHDNAQKTLDEIVKLTAQLKKSKEASTPAVSKFLAELGSAADVAMKDIAKAKVEAEKKTRVDAEAKKQQEKKAAASDEDDDDDESGPAILTTKLLPLLRQVNKGEIMHTLVARAGKQVAVMLSRKPISPAKRKILAEQLGGAGGIKYYTGQCMKEGGATTFALNTEVSGLSKLMKLALLNQTGQRVKKISCRGADGETDDDDDDDDGGGARVAERDDDDQEKGGGRRGKDGEWGDPHEEDVPKFVPGVEIREPSREQLAAAPQAWDGTRELLQRNINSLKRAVQSQIADQNDGFIDEINGNLQKLDRILSKLDRRLADSLATAGAARDPSDRRDALREAKAILAEYIRYVGSEPLIAHLDGNPFGVKTEIRSTLSASLTKLARAIG